MGLEAVKEEILNSAREQANSIIALARQEASKITREANKKIEDLQEKTETETKKIVDTIKRQELASAELETRKMILEAKKQVIESVFAEVNKKLQNLDDEKREFFIKALLEKARKDFEISCVYCNKKDAKFVKGFDIATIDIIGGLIAENKEKNVRVDYSFETTLQSIKENELQDLSKILFE